jgi:serine/threonine-protein kinase
MRHRIVATNDGIGRLASALADRYTVERELGRGGMATVYLAHDLKHDRDVAIKVLHEDFGATLGAERFLTEIRTTARLQHPNILTLIDSGAADGALFYVMPYVAGESLRTRLDRTGPFPIDEALAIVRGVAAALDFAHRQGIVHRDIKPENVLLHEGVPMVADFGIALAVASAGAERLTDAGMSLGTPAYMSPEQVTSERVLDGRCDQYSLACVLYELVSGAPPFKAPTPQALYVKHAIEQAPPLRAQSNTVSAAVAQAVARALAKDPSERFATLAEFVAALCATGAVVAPAAEKSIVVLPFDNLSPDPNDAYLADGLTEELISDLSRIRTLKVISRNSATAVKQRTRDVREIARLVGVRYVLEGSVRHAGDQLRITAQLIDGVTDAHLWTEKYNGTMGNVFAMQERVSREIVEALQLTLSPTESQHVTQRPIPNLVAYECYLRARQEVHGYTREHLARADALLERAEAAAGENALLLACKAWVHMQRYNLAPGPDRTEVCAATALAERARSLDPTCSLAVLVLALLQPFDGRVIDSLLYLRQALALDPSNVDALTWIGYVYAALGRDDDARGPMERALELDPLSHFPAVAAAWVDYQAGRFEEAGARLAPWVAGPEGVLHAACIQCIFALAPLGRLDDMESLATRYQASVPDEPLYQYVRFLYFGLRGDRAGALAELTPGLEEWQRSGHAEYTLHLAQGFAVIGETDRALACLERTVDLQYLNHDFLAHHDPLLAPLRPDPRFQALLARVKREQAQVANV